MNQPDAELLENIEQGDRLAMAEYLQIHRAHLIQVILNKMGTALRSRIEAEDIYQEVCQSALRSLGSVEFTDGGVWGWLCELASRRVVDADRKFSAQKRAAHAEVAIHSAPDQTQAGLANLLTASMTSPSQAFSRQQREFRLLAALEQLPLQQRTALELRYGQGKSSKQVAAEIGKSDGATRVVLTRALHRLRTLMNDTADFPEENDG